MTVSTFYGTSFDLCAGPCTYTPKTVTAHRPNDWKISHYGTVFFFVDLPSPTKLRRLFVCQDGRNGFGTCSCPAGVLCALHDAVLTSQKHLSQCNIQHTVYTSEVRHVNYWQYRQIHTNPQQDSQRWLYLCPHQHSEAVTEPQNLQQHYLPCSKRV